MGKAGSGFKKPAGKKKAFSKKDIIYTSLIAAAVIIFVVILAIVIGNDDFIRTKNGRLQMDDNWLIAEYAKNNGTNYYKIGEVGEIEGFTLSTESAGNTLKTYYPDDLTDNVAVVYVGATASNHAEMAAYLSAYTAAAYGTETAVPVETELVGRDAYFVYCVTDPAETEETDETAEDAADETAEEPAEETGDTEADGTEAADDENEASGDGTEETASDAADETGTEEAETETTGEDLPGCMIYATIEYDDERCIYIQTNTVEVVTEEEARELIDTIADVITLTDR